MAAVGCAFTNGRSVTMTLPACHMVKLQELARVAALIHEAAKKKIRDGEAIIFFCCEMTREAVVNILAAASSILRV